MRKRRVILVVIMVLIAGIMAVGFYSKGLAGIKHSNGIGVKGIKDNIAEVLKNVYTPESMEEFSESREKWVREFMSVEAADTLYQSDGAVLSQSDLQRKLYYDIAYSSDEYNSGNADHYLADIRVENGKGEIFEASIYFYMDKEGQRVDSIEITNVRHY